MDYTIEEKEIFMREALKEAEIALANDEIPIGCVLVKDGQIIEQGNHESLLADKGFYYDLYQSQFSKKAEEV